MTDVWNPWHGCRKKSEGCQNCYMFRRDESIGKDPGEIVRTSSFSLPLQKFRDGGYKLPSGVCYTCMTSDFFIEEADGWREEAWEIIRKRRDLTFVVITKRPERFFVSLPSDWGDGYDNFALCATCENQKRADERLPVLLSLPVKRKEIIHEPMLEKIDISKYLKDGNISRVTCGGESGDFARVCDYGWILDTRRQCLENGVSFYFKQTGAKFRKDGRIYEVPRSEQLKQAGKADIDLDIWKNRKA